MGADIIDGVKLSLNATDGDPAVSHVKNFERSFGDLIPQRHSDKISVSVHN